MPKIRGQIRRSQLVTTYGVGAVIPVGDEAFMVAGLDRWDVHDPDLHEPRLERELRVRGFVQPPTSDDRPDVPVVRFPWFQTCPSCRRLARHNDFTHADLNDCPRCSTALTPSRFVVACEHGHIDDFPYDRWVHKGSAPTAKTHDLELHSTGQTASLAGILIKCSCGAERNMDGSFGQFALQSVTSCGGRRPWQTFDREPCDAVPRTLQRGASSVWFAHTRSALSIPPWSETASRALDAHWATLRHLPLEAVSPILASMRLDEKTGFTNAELVAIFKARKEQEAGEAVGDVHLRREEYEALVRGRKESTADTDFATRAGNVPPSLESWFDQVQLVTRLREVRALAGFSRIMPPHAGDGGTTNIVPLTSEDNEWLPGIEVKGEGIFLRLAASRLASWDGRHDVKSRTRLIADQDRKRHERWGTSPRRAITPTFLLVHVLAHALINQLALEAGYPAGSLRERLYFQDDACGLLIYTATTDSAGSLGGLISQGEHDRLELLVHQAIGRFSWCSADPVCIESEASGAESLNLAACHSCALMPETSCEEMNSFLDRGLLVGTPDDPAVGFFHEL